MKKSINTNSELFGGLVEIRKNRKVYLVRNSSDSEMTIFFHHGAGGRAEQFECQMKHFSAFRKTRVLGFDMVGHGRSEMQPDWSDYNYRELVLDFYAVFKKYRTKRNVIVSHSFGSGISCFAMRYHMNSEEFKSIEKFVLLGTTNSYSVSVLFYLPTFISSADFCRNFVSKQFKAIAYHKDTSNQIIEKESRNARNNEMAMIKALCRQFKFPGKEDRERILKKKTELRSDIQILVLHGETDGVFLPKNGQRVAEELDAEFVIVKKTSHNLLVERPEKITEYLDKFIFPDKNKNEEEIEGEEEEEKN